MEAERPKTTEHNVVPVSGGKDSTATLLKAIDENAENLIAVMADTGNEHELTYEYIDYLEQTLKVPIRRVRADFSGRFAKRRDYLQSDRAVREWPEAARLRAIELMQPTGNPFLDLCMLKGRFPSRMAQFCTHELKVGPMMEQVSLPLLDGGKNRVVSWQGVRADESLARRDKPMWERDLGDDESGAGLWIYRPIIDWSAQDVFRYLAEHGVKPNPLYLQGMGRVGCMPCINAGKNELREIANRFPEHVERIAEWERIVAKVSKRSMATWFTAAGVENELITLETHGIHAKADWAKTARGGKQYLLFDESPACSSAYGLCD